MLKSFVKQPSKRTRNCNGSKFLIDTCNRWKEIQMIHDYNNHLKEARNSTRKNETQYQQEIVEKPTSMSVSYSKFSYYYHNIHQCWCTEYSEKNSEPILSLEIKHPE